MTRTRLRAFSLVEVIVSAALVASAVGAMFATSAMAIRLSTLAQDRLTASELSREGIAIVRQIRDSNFAIDTCSTNVGSGTCHQSWTTGILSPGETLPLPGIRAKQIVLQPNNSEPYTLMTVSDLSSTCTDYLVRNTSTGGITDFTVQPQLKSGQQLFCRRIFIEPVTTNTGNGTNDLTSTNSIRIRSQVAWLDAGKTQLESLSSLVPNGATVAACPGVGASANAATEWCTEQVTILTDWQPSL